MSKPRLLAEGLMGDESFAISAVALLAGLLGGKDIYSLNENRYIPYVDVEEGFDGEYIWIVDIQFNKEVDRDAITAAIYDAVENHPTYSTWFNDLTLDWHDCPNEDPVDDRKCSDSYAVGRGRWKKGKPWPPPTAGPKS